MQPGQPGLGPLALEVLGALQPLAIGIAALPRLEGAAPGLGVALEERARLVAEACFVGRVGEVHASSLSRRAPRGA